MKCHTKLLDELNLYQTQMMQFCSIGRANHQELTRGINLEHDINYFRTSLASHDHPNVLSKRARARVSVCVCCVLVCVRAYTFACAFVCVFVCTLSLRSQICIHLHY